MRDFLIQGWNLGWQERLGVIGLVMMGTGLGFVVGGFGISMIGFACRMATGDGPIR